MEQRVRPQKKSVREQLLADAAAAGYAVTPVGNLLHIHRKLAERAEGVFIYPDETGHVMWSSRRLMTYADMRQALGLKVGRHDAGRKEAQEFSGS